MEEVDDEIHISLLESHEDAGLEPQVGLEVLAINQTNLWSLRIRSSENFE